jgi:hypothetical protein
MRLVSDKEAVGRNAKELAEDHNHARKHSGRDGATPQRSLPRRQSSVFVAGTADQRSCGPETRSLAPGRYIGKYTFEVNAEA